MIDCTIEVKLDTTGTNGVSRDDIGMHPGGPVAQLKMPIATTEGATANFWKNYAQSGGTLSNKDPVCGGNASLLSNCVKRILVLNVHEAKDTV